MCFHTLQLHLVDMLLVCICNPAERIEVHRSVIGLLRSLRFKNETAHGLANFCDGQSKHVFHIGTDTRSKYQIGASLVLST